MELDGTEMLDDSVSDLEIPDLTADNDQLLSGDVGTSADEMDTMMDLAKAYIDMGDKDSASSALGEIVKGGSPEQKTEAETLLRKIS
jgi:pilus assembly protein FimV